MALRKRAVAALTGVIVAVGLAISPSPASASGGGCIDHIRNGWNIGVCSSDNGVRVYGDIYVNRRGSLGSTCYIKILILRSSGSQVAERTDGCYSGHHSPISYVMNGGSYYTYASVVVNGKIVASGGSPPTYDS